jgi:cbb3-type cytochrome oxidase subunit 3
MNPIIREAAGQVQLGWLMGIMTGLFLACFVFWIWWAWRAKNRGRWEEASRLPFNDGGES